MTKNRMTKLQMEREEDRIHALDNFELLTETIEAASGDDYDGCFTDWGEWQFKQLKTELSARLIFEEFIDKELE